MKKMRKTLALVLCLVLCLGMLPTWALAENVSPVEEPAAELMQEETQETPEAEQATEPEIPAEEPPVYEESAPEETVVEVLPELSEEVWSEETPDAAESAEAEEPEVPTAEDNDSTEAESVPVNAETTEPATEPDVQDPAEPAEETDTAPVAVVFTVTPEEAELLVYIKDEYDEKTEIDPEEDGSYLLLPGEYFYTLTAEGYLAIEEELLTVESSTEAVEVSIEMVPEDPAGAPEQNEVPHEAPEEEETASLMAGTVHSYGTCGANLTWTLYNDGTLIISGTGDMENYNWDKEIEPEWNKNLINRVIVEEGVTSIGQESFDSCPNLKEVSLPSTMKKIIANAFYGVKSLEQINFPDGLEAVGPEAFYNCTGLSSVILPDSVKSIGSQAFRSCTGIVELSFPGTADVFQHAFSYCTSLKSIVIPEGITSIANWAFAYCTAATELKLPSTLTKIGEASFNGCSSLTELVIPDGVTVIGDASFGQCSAITKLVVPASVTSLPSTASGIFSSCSLLKTAGPIGGGYDYEYGWTQEIPAMAFAGCKGLTSIVLPDELTTIGSSAFSGCSGLSKITVPAGVTKFNGYAFSKCESIRTAGPIGGGYDYEYGWTDAIPSYAFSGITNLTSVRFPSSLTSIGSYCCYDCTSLSDVLLPDGLKTIGTFAFAKCYYLEQLLLPDSLEKIGSDAFRECPIQSMVIPEGVTNIESSTFYKCWHLVNLSIPSSVTTIGSSAFGECSSLSGLILPESLNTIDSYAFYSCTGLKSLVIPEKVTGIGSSAFQSCSNLSEIQLKGNMPTIGTNAFKSVTATVTYPYSGEGYTSETMLNYGGTLTWQKGAAEAGLSGTCGDDLTWRLDENNILTISGTGAMWDYDFPGGNKAPWGLQVAEVLVEPGTTSIGKCAFYNCSQLTAVTLPDTITKIGDSAFYKCSKLGQAPALTAVESIGDNAFNGCVAMSGITIPDGVTKIGQRAFYECRSITEIQLPAGLTYIETGTFDDCTGLTEVIIPPSVTTIRQQAFYGCSAITKLVVPATVTNMEEDAFGSCTGLETAGPIGGAYNYQFGWTNEIPAYAFSGCISLYSIDFPSGITKIGDCAFSFCRALSSVTIPENVTEIGYKTFMECSALQTVKLPEGLKTIGEAAFANGESLEAITLPNSVESIGQYAFSYSAALKEITLSKNLTSIGSKAFDSCLKLRDVVMRGNMPAIASYAFLHVTATVSYPATASGYTQEKMLQYGGTLTWEATGIFMVSYDANGGTGAPAAQAKKYGEALILSMEEPTREGHHFLGWATNKTATSPMYQPGATYTNEGNATLYAVWQLNTYTVSYDANGGSNAPAAQTKEHGTDLTLHNEEPTFDGHNFLGWATDPDAQEALYAPGDVYQENTDSILYAVWQLKTYTVSYDANGGSNAPATQMKEHGTDLTLHSDEPTFEGHDFLGWATDPDAQEALYAPGDVYRENADNILYAVWQLKTYTVSYDANGGNNTPPAQTKTHGTPLTLSGEKPSREGFRFLGWATEATSMTAVYQPGDEYRTESDAILYAVWQPLAENVEIWCYFTEPGTDENGNPTMVRNEAMVNGQTFERIDISQIQRWTQLFTKVLPQNASQEVTWSAEPAECATIDINGHVTFLKTGIVTVHAAAADGTDKSAWVKFELVKALGTGESETGLQWTLMENSDGTAALQLALAAQAETASIDEAPWLEYADQITSVVIPSGVTEIGTGAFEGCTGLKEIQIPSSVEKIGENAFNNCGSLTSVDYIGTQDTWEKIEISAGNEALSESALTLLSCEDLNLEHVPCEAVRENEIPATKEAEGSYDEVIYCKTCRKELERRAVTVPKLPTNYVLSSSRLELEAGKSRQLHVLDGDTGKTISTPDLFIWTSSNEEIAKADKGTITGVKPGSAVITVQTNDGQYEGRCFVKILFQDVSDPDAYFHDAVYWAVENGITSGKTATSFAPYDSCTRAQVMSFLYKAKGSPEVSGSNPFTDVKESDYFYKPVLWAVSQGITSGTSATTFSPYNPCTRAQVMSFLYKAMGSPEVSGSNPFTAVKASDYFYKPVLWAVSRGITNGTSATTFGPYNTCTRAQVMTFLYKAMN